MLQKAAVAIDLGGTNLKSAVVNSSGKILHQQTIPSKSKESAEEMLDHLILSIQRELDWGTRKRIKILGIGLGIPGIVSPDRGIVYQSPHFPNWKNFPILKKLKEKFSLSLVMSNDANMAALGEGWIGAARGKRNFVLLTLGTGIGGAIIIDQKIFHGDSGFAGEIGHLVIDRHGLPCNCGGRGCLEMYASSTGISHALVRQFPSPSPKTLFELAKKKDSFALKIYQQFGEALGVGIASILNLLDIETILLGGGLSAAWKFFIPSTLESISKHIYETTAKRIHLKKAKLGNQAGVIGAARGVFLKK